MAVSSASTQIVESLADRELVFTRVFDAPREQVFEACADPKQVGQWWGPKGFTNTIYEMDVRPGGTWRLTMHGPDGVDYKNKIVFLEVVKPERLVYNHEPAWGSDPLTVEVTVTFIEEEGGKTRLTMRLLFPSATVRKEVIKKDGVIEGANQTLARLSDHLAGRATINDVPSDRELAITRVFDAPRDLVFQAWTKPEHLERWQGAPQGFTVIFHAVDLRPGGAYKICMRSPEGVDYWLQGVYREVVEPSRLVFTHGWLDANGKPGIETLVTITFTERAGKTELTLRQTGFASKESRNGHSGGWTSTFDRMTEYLMTLEKEQAS